VVPLTNLLAFAGVAFLLIVVPGPSVLFVISRGVALGRRAALATVFGNVAGVYVQVIVVALGLGSLVEHSVALWQVVKLLGAAYLVYLGVRTVRDRHALARMIDRAVVPTTSRRIVREGFIVGLTNPKASIFFAAVLPQFIDPTGGSAALQLLELGLVFGVIAVVSDSGWALLSGTVRTWLSRSPRRIAALGGVGGLVMVGLGLRLAFAGQQD
jgi:threonine/homoserine/homoserine lactone efflux protein